MSLVNHETGDIVEFDRAAAERRAERITMRLDAIAENYSRVLPMIREAIEKRDDLALGYRSPGDYVSDRFGQSLAGLGIEVRRAVVGELTAAGMSTRAIAPVVGVSHMQVARDRDAGVTDVTPAPQTPASPSLGEDGDEAGMTPEAAWKPVPPAAGEQDPDSDSSLPAPPPPVQRPVTGIDGKTYARPTPSAPRRRPLTDAFWTAVYDVEKRVRTLRNLTEDDRWTQNAEKVATANRGDLLRINDLLQQVISALPTEESTQ